MPIYEFRCNDCGHDQEFLLKIDELPTTPCAKCQSLSLEKCVTAPRFRLKGQGYYETDEKSKSKQRYIASSGNDGESASGSGCQKTACDHTSH
jgi:putative FmdB family regulatory protein